MRIEKMAVLALGLLACGDEVEPTDDKLRADVEAFEVEHEKRVLEVCDATEEEINEEDAQTEGARCYFELAFAVDTCALYALDAHPKEGRGYFECAKQDLEDLIDCCEDGAPCSYDRIETCYGTLWDGEFSSDCAAEIDISEIEAEAEACRGEESGD